MQDDVVTVRLGTEVVKSIDDLFKGRKEDSVEVEYGDAYSRIAPKYKPYRHQEVAVNEGYRDFKKYGFHAFFMDMGTGKTKTTLDTAAILASDGMITGLVVICPSPLTSTWANEELPKHMCIPYVVNVWDGKKTKKSRAAFNAVVASPLFAVFVINIEAFQTGPEEMRERFKAFMKARPSLMAIDESSFIKNPKANRTKLIKSAGRLAKYRTILTGTEITTSPLDLYAQFEFLFPGFWGVRNYFIFRAHFAVLEDQYGSGQRTFKKVVGYKCMKELMGKVAPYVSRALKKDCLDLPPKQYETIYVELSEKQHVVYDSLKKHLAAVVSQGVVLTVPNKIALFTKFRQVTGGIVKVDGDSKVIDDNPAKLQALIADLYGTDDQAIVWCCFNSEIEMVVAALRKEFGSAAPYCGLVDKNKLEEYKVGFQHGDIRFLVLNPAEGSYGLNLQNCHIVYKYSIPLSPGQNWQGEDRIDRSGQVHQCIYKSLLARGTVDERVAAIIAARTTVREKFRDGSVPDSMTLSGDESPIDPSALSEKDILDLV